MGQVPNNHSLEMKGVKPEATQFYDVVRLVPLTNVGMLERGVHSSTKVRLQPSTKVQRIIAMLCKLPANVTRVYKMRRLVGPLDLYGVKTLKCQRRRPRITCKMGDEKPQLD